jgi:hypothetical protein
LLVEILFYLEEPLSIICIFTWLPIVINKWGDVHEEKICTTSTRLKAMRENGVLE